MEGERMSVVGAGSLLPAVSRRAGCFGVLVALVGTAVSALPAPARASSGQLAYVALDGAFGAPSRVAVVDTSTDSTVATVTLPTGVAGLAVNPAGTEVLVATGGASLQVLDTASDTLTGSIPVGSATDDVVFSPDGTRAYVGDGAGSGSVEVLDTGTHAVLATIPAGGRDLAVSADGTRVYSTSPTGVLSVIDTASDTVTATVVYGQDPGAVAVSPDGTRVYVTDLTARTVSAIDTATGTISAVIPVPQNPTDIAVNPSGTEVYITSAPSGTLSVIDTGTNTVTGTVTRLGYAVAVAVGADGSAAYVASENPMSGTGGLSTVDAATLTETAGGALAGLPVSIALGPLAARTTTALSVAPSGTAAQGSPVTLTATTLGIAVHELSAAFIPAGPGYLASASAVAQLNVVPPGVFVEQGIVRDGTGTATAPLSISGPRLLVALVSSDGPLSGQRITITGAGLTWTLVRRANSQGGTAEIWSASAPGPLTGATITSTPRFGGYDQQLTVLVLFGASGIGASAVAGHSGGTPQVSLTTTRPNSRIIGVGEDYTNATTPVPGTGQFLLGQWVDTAPGETFWTQQQVAAAPAAGTTATLNDSSPTGDTWNMAAAEFLSGP
jgi:YVTN family beta-propeller protein